MLFLTFGASCFLPRDSSFFQNGTFGVASGGKSAAGTGGWTPTCATGATAGAETAFDFLPSDSSFFQNGTFVAGSGGKSAAGTGGCTTTASASGAGGSSGSASHGSGPTAFGSIHSSTGAASTG